MHREFDECDILALTIDACVPLARWCDNRIYIDEKALIEKD